MTNTPAMGEIAKWIAILNGLRAESGADEVSLVFRYPNGSALAYSTDESLGDENELDHMGMEIKE